MQPLDLRSALVSTGRGKVDLHVESRTHSRRAALPTCCSSERRGLLPAPEPVENCLQVQGSHLLRFQLIFDLAQHSINLMVREAGVRERSIIVHGDVAVSVYSNVALVGVFWVLLFEMFLELLGLLPVLFVQSPHSQVALPEKPT